MCSGNTAQVSWLASDGAVRYDVQALGRDGDDINCTTDTTTCSLPSMHCAVTYTITVTPYSDTCSGFSSTPILFIAGTLFISSLFRGSILYVSVNNLNHIEII